MWIPRTPEQVEKWHASSRREARFNGRLYAGGVCLIIPLILAGGWTAGAKGTAAQGAVSGGSFWSRFLIFVLLCLPVAYLIYRRECKKEMERALRMTICPKCETAGEDNAETPCSCGGTFVPQSTVRWADEEPKA